VVLYLALKLHSHFEYQIDCLPREPINDSLQSVEECVANANEFGFNLVSAETPVLL